MAYNTKAIKVDINAKPVPQYFNPTLDDYEPLYGDKGAMRVLLYDANGNPLLTEPNPGYIRAADGAIAALGAKADAAVTDPTLSASEIALLKGLLKQLQGGGTGALPVSLNGSFAAIKSAPVVGAKTVSTTAAELFAGASRLANRYAMVVYNEASIPVYWGPSGVTTANGFVLLPQDSIVFQFSPSVATAVYFVASSSAAVRVVELA